MENIAVPSSEPRIPESSLDLKSGDQERAVNTARLSLSYHTLVDAASLMAFAITMMTVNLSL